MKNKVKKRAEINSKVLDRDRHKCVICAEYKYILDIHHIMDRHYFDNHGYVLENLITLCEDCHLLAEEYHRTNAQNSISGYHTDDLYKKINSSFELAIEKDNKNV